MFPNKCAMLPCKNIEEKSEKRFWPDKIRFGTAP
jgi:hypothetical protein